jgi:hypothetical protein
MQLPAHHFFIFEPVTVSRVMMDSGRMRCRAFADSLRRKQSGPVVDFDRRAHQIFYLIF